MIRNDEMDEPPTLADDYFPGPNECRYILDNGPWSIKQPPQWCRKRIAQGSVYCPEHAARCYSGRDR